MNNMNLYLAHPLELRHEVREWELNFEEKTGIQLINPFYDIVERIDIKGIDKGLIHPRNFKQKKEGKFIIERDLNQIAKANGLVAFIEKDSQSFGTPMELFYNSRILQRPSYVITATQLGHPWVRGLANKCFKNKENFEKYCLKCLT